MLQNTFCMPRGLAMMPTGQGDQVSPVLYWEEKTHLPIDRRFGIGHKNFPIIRGTPEILKRCRCVPHLDSDRLFRRQGLSCLGEEAERWVTGAGRVPNPGRRYFFFARR